MTGSPPGSPLHPRVLVAHPGVERYGSDRMLLESVRGMLADGQQVLAALPGPGPLADDLQAAGAGVTFVATPVLRKSALSPRGLARLAADTLAALPATVRLLAHRPDAVYVSTVTIPLWNVAARVAGRPTVVHVHEAESGSSRALGAALALPVLCAHRVLANSEFSAGVLARSMPALAARTDVVLNGVTGPDRPSPARSSVQDGLRLLYVGRLSPRKGPDVLLAAARLLRAGGVPVTVRLVGDVFAGYEWFAEQLRREHAVEIEEGSVQLHGFCDDVWPHLAWADVAVVPSVLPEPFGNTAVEAALAGRPVVVSDCGGLPEAVAGLAGARVVPPKDPRALADTLQELVRVWPLPAQQAFQDVAAARRRFAPSTYRSRVAASTRPGHAH